jgi:general secretion pathway protein G
MDKAPKSKMPSLDFLLFLILLLIFLNALRPRFYSHGGEARITRAQTEIATFTTALQMFQIDTGAYPSTTQGLVPLILRPPGTTNWHGSYLAERSAIPLDPWGHKYVYEHSTAGSVQTCAVISWGSDGRPGGGDDISNRWVVK